ncbi:glycosyltransferase [Flammeovirga pectinis]|uniref:Glycosyltransferase n=1 Tax=Flammeovirga pectinis TaxID=2494373 RepID=A0A3Q9FS70_9BACT|nr:glycosyltransferase family 4 protein [Flammeovirga pectinis]AZQ63511.1 glycosyltransferase [Flammeovirga pectinis]
MKKKIAFICADNPNDKRAWSGTAHTIFTILNHNYDTIWNGPIKINFKEKIKLFINKYSNKNFGGRLANERNILISKIYSSYVSQFINSHEFDYVFICAVPFMGAYINTKTPIIYLSDATFENMIDFYSPFKRLNKKGIVEGHEIENLLLSKSKHVIFSSDWALKSAINYYNCNSNKVSLLDFGANIPLVEYKENIPSEYINNTCRLLFSGVDWERKGGELAYRVFLELLKRNINSELIIIGCNPNIKNKKVTIIPFLNKNNKEDLSIFNSYFKESTFFILPSIADCTPIVFSEAAANSLPVLSTKVGGIASVIEEGINGFTFKLDASEKDYADKIEQLWNNKNQLIQLRKTSLQEYNRRLNWNTWSEKFDTIIENI